MAVAQSLFPFDRRTASRATLSQGAIVIVSRMQFDHEASEKQANLFDEVIHFLSQNKKWWLLAVLMFLVFFVGTGAAPFIYTLF
jgi:flagellar biosynthesis/type III secretory pathway M-ring protein FliF/YscJ